MTCQWLPHQQAVLDPPEDLTTTEWSEEYVFIPSRLSPLHHGPYSSEITPYLVEVQDCMGDNEHQWVVIMKSVQCGGSQATRNAFLHWLSKRPYPILLVYPDEDAAKFNLKKKILPGIKACPKTNAFISGRKWDVKNQRIALTHTDIAAGWSGSAQSLASDPFGSVICDEVDNFAEFAGSASDPVSLAVRRTTTFKDKRKIVLLSTPTTTHGQISKAFEGCEDKREYWLPCPHCGEFFLPSFRLLSYVRVHEENKREAARLENEQCVSMACPDCGVAIDEKHKPQMVRKGRWRSRGFAFGEHPSSERVGFHITGLISLIGISWSNIAANHLRAQGDYAALMNFFNNDLGEPFEDQVERISSRLFRSKADRGHPHGIVPSWGATLIASADTQKDHFWYMIRAWGRGGVSRLIHHGRAETFSDLYQKTLLSKWQVENTTTLIGAHCLLIDSGGTKHAGEEHSKTAQVYRFSKTDPRIWPTKGRQTGAKPVQPSNITYRPPGYTASIQVLLRWINTEYFKDVLAFTLREGTETEKEEQWQEHREINDVYAKQMASEHKVAERKGQSVKLVWKPLSSGTPNHLWDCAVLQMAGAFMLEVSNLPDEKSLKKRRKERPPRRKPKSKYKRKGKPWISQRRRSR